jgi:hypothetical protein
VWLIATQQTLGTAAGETHTNLGQATARNAARCPRSPDPDPVSEVATLQDEEIHAGSAYTLGAMCVVPRGATEAGGRC